MIYNNILTILILLYVYIYYNVPVLYRLHGEMESHSSHIVAGVKEGAYVNLQVRTFLVPFFFQNFSDFYLFYQLFIFFYLYLFLIFFYNLFSYLLFANLTDFLAQSTGGWTPIIFAASLGTLNHVI